MAALVLATWATCGPALLAQLPPPERLEPVRRYIKQSWTTLTRSNRDLPAAARDPKMKLEPGKPWPVYVAAGENRERVTAGLRRVLNAEQLATIEIRALPDRPLAPNEHGLLYLPRPYVVPGGRFNEMYGWDSYFIQVGCFAMTSCRAPGTWSRTSCTRSTSYDVRRRESDVSAGIRFGYSSNEIGFGWTNAVVLELLAGLRQPAAVKR